MKKFKNKLFYLYSFLIYLFLVVVISFIASRYLDSSVNSFLIRNFVSIKNGSSNVIEVVIDDDTDTDINYKPWGRKYETQILDYFYTYAKPKVVGLDMILVNFDDTKASDIKYLNQVSKMDNFVTGFNPQVIPKGNEEYLSEELFKKKYALDVDLKRSNFPQAYPTVKYLAKVSSSTKNLASVLIVPEEYSGELFSTINVIKVGDSFYPSLALKMYLIANNTNKIIIDDKYITIPKTGVKIPYTVTYNGITKTNIRYYDNVYSGDRKTDYSHSVISARTILNTYKALQSGITPESNPELYDIQKGGYANPEIFKDKVVLIGSNISGPSADVHKTPMGARHPGLDIQTTSYDNIASNYFLSYSTLGFSIIAVLLMCLISFVVILKFKFFKGLLSLIGLSLAYFIVVVFISVFGTILPCAVPFAAQLVTVIFGYSFKFLSENRNKEKIKQAMGKYLSQDIMNNVVSNIDDLKLGGKRAIVTVLFSDIRGFTSLSEKMSAEEVSMILNEYFAEMEPIITKYNGVINKFIGDAVMAIFGEPIQDINHARNAVKCAYEMLKKVEYLREKWLFEGKPKIEIGVGINTGEVFIGNIGTETRMEYTVIGDTVNLASRIESYNKVYKTNLLVSSSTYAHIADIADVIKISEVQIRGKAKKMNIYEVLRIDRDKKDI